MALDSVHLEEEDAGNVDGGVLVAVPCRSMCHRANFKGAKSLLDGKPSNNVVIIFAFALVVPGYPD